MKDGPQKILTQANKMGIPPVEADPEYPGIPNTSRDLDADALITLGKARVSAINMANTYATIANGGQRADVHVISKVVDSTGEVKYQYKPHTTEAIKPDIDRDVSYCPAAGGPARHRARTPRRSSARRPARRGPRPTTTATSRRRGSSGSPRSWRPP